MKKNKILIVDDEIVGRQLLQALLMVEGYETIVAESGQEALQLADRLNPDLILMDIMMPELNGFEVTKRFRQMDAFKETPIVLVTALDDRDSKSKGLSVGANEYISKPFDRIQVLDTLERLLK